MGVLFWRGGAYSDLLISHWPNAAFVRHSLAEWGQVPLWNPMILSGTPFAADPLSGLYYPPNWLAVAISPNVAFNVLAWLHIAWGGLGTWKLSRALGVSSGPAIVAGLAFAGMPKLIGHIGLGHVSLVFAVAWTPWVLFAFENAVHKTDGKRWLSAALAGAALGTVFLIDPRWYLPLALLSFAYVAWRFAHSHKEPTGESHGDNLKWGRAASSLVVAGLISLSIAAILAIPFGEFVSLSTRANLSLAEAAELSLPASNLLNALAPEYAGWPEWQVYAGVVVLFLALVALMGRAEGRWFWAGIVVFSLILATGNLTPLYRLTTTFVPGFGQLRVPPRSLFLFSFALAMLAGLGLDQMLKGKVQIQQIRIIGLALSGVALVLALWFWLQEEAALQAAAFVVSAALIGLSTIWAGVSTQNLSRWSVIGWCLLIVFDLSLINLTTLEVRPRPEAMDLPARMRTDHSRAFSPSYSLPVPTAASAGLELADGINPLQLASYWEYMARATGFNGDQYSVTLPPFLKGDPLMEWGFDPDLALLGNLSISQVVSAYPITNTGLIYEGEQEGRHYYSNPQTRPRAWIEGGEPAEILAHTPNRLVIRATGPGVLIASEISYPGWEAEIDGARASIETREGLLRAVQLSPGEHEVEFTFRSGSLRAGALLTLLGLIILGSLWIRR